MQKKLLTSLSSAILVALTAIGLTSAFFSDEEKSVGNTFQAGAIDLKIDHTRQTYNDVDCKTCSVLLISDPTNMVTEKNGVPIPTPYPAIFLNPIHPAWTAQNDPSLLAAGAKWIWEQNPVKPEDTTVDTIYTFKKEFTWLGPIESTDLSMAVGHDNTVKVYLNTVLIGEGTNIYGFQQENMLHIPAANITANIVQGNNVLEIELRNRAESNGNPANNPAGLIYKFEINGQCSDDFFRNQCRLWDTKDLGEGDIFWNFDDLKPGDRGLNVISYRIDDNDAWMCTELATEDLENVMIEPESPPDTVGPDGELSKYVETFVWHDNNANGAWDAGESMIIEDTLNNLASWPIAQPTGAPVPASTTNYLGFAWCFGDLTAVINTPFACTGAGNHNDAQTDKVLATISFYVEQARNNPDFTCSKLTD
jgi:predicted ribosomally synthesized peptide with SipW-like signal peptide